MSFSGLVPTKEEKYLESLELKVKELKEDLEAYREVNRKLIASVSSKAAKIRELNQEIDRQDLEISRLQYELGR